MTVIDAPSPVPPAIVTPAAREVSFGHVSGSVPKGTRRIIVRVGEHVVVDRPLRGRRFSLDVELPARAVTLRVTSVGGDGRRASSTVESIVGLPPGASPRAVAARLDGGLAAAIRGLASGFSGTSGIYVRELLTGRGAAWNAAARFPAASTLKLAIAVTVLGRSDGKPPSGSVLGGLLHKMIVDSDNRAANELEVWLGGSTGSGSAQVDELMRALGLRDSLMYGGYVPSPLRRLASLSPIPIRADVQPPFGVGKYTSAADLSRLLWEIYLGAGGKGSLPGLGVTAAESRHLLWLLAAVGDRGKLGRFLPDSTVLLHKAGWLANARHDSGLVFWSGGAYVATVMTWRGDGVGVSADVLAGKVAATLRQR